MQGLLFLFLPDDLFIAVGLILGIDYEYDKDYGYEDRAIGLRMKSA